jgi:predicted nucleic acid-binding protein
VRNWKKNKSLETFMIIKIVGNLIKKAKFTMDCDAGYLVSEDMQDGFKLENKLTIINPFV